MHMPIWLCAAQSLYLNLIVIFCVHFQALHLVLHFWEIITLLDVMGNKEHVRNLIFVSVRTPYYNFGQVSILFTYVFNQVRCVFHLIYRSYIILFLVDTTTFQYHLSLSHLLNSFQR